MLTNVKAGGIRCVEILCIENKAGESEPLEAKGEGGFGSPDATAILQLFLKNTHILGIIWSKFHIFKWLHKLFIQGLRPGTTYPHLPPFPCYNTECKDSCYCYSIIVF